VEIDPRTGLLTSARFVPSPNRDARPAGMRPELVVIHGITLPPGEYGGPWIDHLFTNRLDPEAHPDFRAVSELRVSAHVLIRRDGEIVQYVPFHQRAWHAGVSEWEGREAVNDFSIGIELEGTDEAPYEEAQYRALAGMIRALAATYPGLRDDRGAVCLAGHSDVAPGRKSDPGQSFDWAQLRDRLRALVV
jgi:N-acetyl-anhydromuramoyl-L-alanine amidase